MWMPWDDRRPAISIRTPPMLPARAPGRQAGGAAGQKMAKPQAALKESDVEQIYFRVTSLTLMACWKYLSACSLSPSWRCMVARLL